MTVTVEASSFNDSALLDGGCYTDGCEPALTQVRVRRIRGYC